MNSIYAFSENFKLKSQAEQGKIIQCQLCSAIATHHHAGNHFCVEHAREYSQKAKWKRVMFWHTPAGVVFINGEAQALKCKCDKVEETQFG